MNIFKKSKNNHIFTYHFSFPPVGMRIIKTAIAVFLCLMIYILRGYQGLVVHSAIAAIICMQPYAKDSKESGINRILGTLIGAFWGLCYLFFFRSQPWMVEHMILIYLCIAFGVVLCLYTSVLTRTHSSAGLAAIVFLCVIITYPDVDAPVAQTLNRCADTIIGAIVGNLVNAFHLPRRKHPEHIFFLRLQDLVEDRFSHVSSRVLIELNRLYDEGAHICLESKWAPAFLISQMGCVNINMPIIVLDGAAVYDIRDNRFLDVNEITKQDAAYLCHFFDRQNLGHLVFAIRNDSMLFFRQGQMNQADEEEYQLMRRSPYRNYLNGRYHKEDQIAAIRVMLADEEVADFEEQLEKDSIVRIRFRVTKRVQPRVKGYTAFYFMNKTVSMEAMEHHILEHLPLEDLEYERIPERILPSAISKMVSGQNTIKREDLKAIHILPYSVEHYQKKHSVERNALMILQKLKNIYEPYWFLK